MRFSSAILLAWARKSATGGRGVAVAVPAQPVHLRLRAGATAVPLLDSAAGLSVATITRLTEQWKDDATAFAARSLAGLDYVYLCVDGIHFKVRLEQDKVYLLVMIGERADGKKELVALADGFRASAESWAELLRDCRRRGMRAPVFAFGDGALGFWKALREVFPAPRKQRCWFTRLVERSRRAAQVGPPGRRGRARRDLQRRGICSTRPRRRRSSRPPTARNSPKAVAKLSEHLEVLLAFYEYPAEHWIHESAQAHWRAVNASHLVALVRARAKFANGNLIGKPTNQQLISKPRDLGGHETVETSRQVLRHAGWAGG